MHDDHMGPELRALLKENACALSRLRATLAGLKSNLKILESVAEVAETAQVVQNLRAGDSVAN